jgi:hypothetical protein
VKSPLRQSCAACVDRVYLTVRGGVEVTLNLEAGRYVNRPARFAGGADEN